MLHQVSTGPNVKLNHVESEHQAADIFTNTFESGVKWVTLLALINVTLPNEFRSLAHSHCSVSVAAVGQRINFPWDRRALDTCISKDCIWEGDVVFGFTLPDHRDSHIPPLERGHGSCPYSGIVDDHINKLSLNLDQCTDAYERISRAIIRHHKSRKLAWFHRVERDIDPDEHSVAINGIVSLIGLFVKHKFGILVECPRGSPFLA